MSESWWVDPYKLYLDCLAEFSVLFQVPKKFGKSDL